MMDNEMPQWDEVTIEAYVGEHSPRSLTYNRYEMMYERQQAGAPLDETLLSRAEFYVGIMQGAEHLAHSPISYKQDDGSILVYPHPDYLKITGRELEDESSVNPPIPYNPPQFVVERGTSA